METSQNTITSDPEPLNLKIDDRFLREPAQKVDHQFPHDLIHFSNSLTITREKFNGIGLAANQVGVPYRVISIKGIDSCLFNPLIVDKSEDHDSMDEGCLSFPGLIVRVPRSKRIRVRFMNALGEIKTQDFLGMTARVIQHEIDHLDAVMFYDRAHFIHKERAMRKWKQYKRRNK